MDDFFRFSKKFWGIVGPPYCDIGVTIRIVQEMLCLPYVGFLLGNIGIILDILAKGIFIWLDLNEELLQMVNVYFSHKKNLYWPL